MALSPALDEAAAPPGPHRLEADAAAMAAFFDCLFRYADPQGFVSLRAFPQARDGGNALRIEAVGAGADALIVRAARMADFAAAERGVFCPPIALFKTARSAAQDNILEAPAISVDLDIPDAEGALARLEALIGPATVVVHSGSLAIDADGVATPKAHAHWRLSEPARGAQDIDRVREARRLAALLVGGDLSAASPAHPMRWPGSWNVKPLLAAPAGAPRMARIVRNDGDAEVDLGETLDRLRDAVEAHGLRAIGGGTGRAGGDPEADIGIVREALEIIPNADLAWSDWNRIAMAAWRATGGSDAGLDAFRAWSAKSRKHDPAITEARWQHLASSPPTRIGAGTLVHEARQASPGWRPGVSSLRMFKGETRLRKDAVQAAEGDDGDPRAEDERDPDGRIVGLADFRAHMPDHRYIFMPTRDLWPAASVNSRLPWPEDHRGKPMPPSRWLDQNAPVEQMTWAPGEPTLIEGRVIDGGGWIERGGCTVFNLYRPPAPGRGDPNDVGPWLDHLRRVYPQDWEHLVCWFAQRVQAPGIKINHALVLGGKQGIGKDTILEPLKHAVGPWNFQEISPSVLLGRFTGFAKSVILRISEARDLGDVDRFAFYDHAKVYTAAPPDVIRVDEKNLREHSVMNVCGVIITTNHKSDGIYLPADDRRHYVAWSEADRSDFADDYWKRLWRWYERGGIANVAAYLAQFDLSGFDPKAPPPKTDAFWHIVNAARPPEEAELADVLDGLGNPHAVTLEMLMAQAGAAHPAFADWLADRRSRRQIPHRLEGAGYVQVHNATSKDGHWTIQGRRQAVYAKAELTLRDRIAAATAMARRWNR